MVVQDDFDWIDDRPLETPLEELIIYEMHVRGFTRSPTSGVDHPGTFLGVVEKIPYLRELGVTAVELLPVSRDALEGTGPVIELAKVQTASADTAEEPEEVEEE